MASQPPRTSRAPGPASSSSSSDSSAAAPWRRTTTRRRSYTTRRSWRCRWSTSCHPFAISVSTSVRARAPAVVPAGDKGRDGRAAIRTTGWRPPRPGRGDPADAVGCSGERPRRLDRALRVRAGRLSRPRPAAGHDRRVRAGTGLRARSRRRRQQELDARPPHQPGALLGQHLGEDPREAADWDRLRVGYRQSCWELACEEIDGLGEQRRLFSFADSPRDLERRFSTTRNGSLRHGALHPGQTLIDLPHRSCVDGRTPLPGVFLGGGGTHPGVP